MSFQKARYNCPTHIGAAQIIREALRIAGEPLSLYKITLATGLKTETAKRSISDMCSCSGGVVSLRGPKGVRYYALYKAPPAPSRPIAGEEFKVAGKISEVCTYRNPHPLEGTGEGG